MIRPHEAAEAGAAWLDTVRPDWFLIVTPDTLDLSCEQDCVLGQVFGSYVAGLAAMFENEDVDVFSHGFDAEYPPDSGTSYAAIVAFRSTLYQALAAAWRFEIQRRRDDIPGVHFRRHGSRQRPLSALYQNDEV